MIYFIWKRSFIYFYLFIWKGLDKENIITLVHRCLLVISSFADQKKNKQLYKNTNINSKNVEYLLQNTGKNTVLMFTGLTGLKLLFYFTSK